MIMHLASRNMLKEMTFVNKTLSKEIMNRTMLRYKFLKNGNDYNKREFSKQGTTVCSC